MRAILAAGLICVGSSASAADFICNMKPGFASDYEAICGTKVGASPEYQGVVTRKATDGMPRAGIPPSLTWEGGINFIGPAAKRGVRRPRILISVSPDEKTGKPPFLAYCTFTEYWTRCSAKPE